MKTLVTTLLYLASTAVFCQNLSLQEVLSYSFPSELTASKSGGAITWVENKEGVRNIFYALSPHYEATQLTPYMEDDGQEISELGFTEDLKSIVFSRGGAPNRVGEIPNPTTNPQGYKREIYIAELETGFPRLLGEGHHPLIMHDQILFIKGGTVWIMDQYGENQTQLFQIRGGVSSLSLSPDKSILAFVNGRGDHSFIGLYKFSDGSLKLLDPSLDRDSDPVWSPDGSKIAYLRGPWEEPEMFAPQRKGLPFSIMVYDLNTDSAQKIFSADEGTGSVFRFISAENQIFWSASDEVIFPWEKDGWTHLYSIPSSGGEPKCLTPGKFEVQFVSQSPDRKSIIFSSNQNDINRQHIWSYSDSLVQHTSGSTIEWMPVIDGNGGIFCLGSTGTIPADVKEISKRRVINITNETSYPSQKLVEPREVTFKSADGITIHGQLFVPSNLEKREKLPAVLFFHGGSRRQMLLGFHHRGYYHYAYAMNQYLAANGYIVLSVNYRGGIGYGMEFREALNYGAAGASEYQDVLAAADFLKKHQNVDSERLGLWGGSYGGYLTALGLAKNSDIFKAGVDIHGVYDWNNVIKGFMPSYDALKVPEFSKKAYESSPAAVMNGWKSPVLLIHGDDDRNVPFSETVQKASKLRELGVEFEQLVFPDEVHGFLLHQNWYEAYEAAKNFFDRKL